MLSMKHDLLEILCSFESPISDNQSMFNVFCVNHFTYTHTHAHAHATQYAVTYTRKTASENILYHSVGEQNLLLLVLSSLTHS